VIIPEGPVSIKLMYTKKLTHWYSFSKYLEGTQFESHQGSIPIHILSGVRFFVSTLWDPQFTAIIISLIIRRTATVFCKVDGYTFKRAGRSGVRIPAGEIRNFSILQTLQAGSGVPASSYLMDTENLSREQNGRDVNLFRLSYQSYRPRYDSQNM